MNFSHTYYKLDHFIFPTVRSVNYLERHRLEVGDWDKLYIRGKKIGSIYIIGRENKAIKDMSLGFLQFDGNCPDFHINTKQDYINLLNSFLPKGWGHNNLNTIKSIIWCQK